jgi:hypothetical protein
MIDGPDGKVYLGAVSGYGKLGGPLVVWNPQTGQVDPYPQLVTDESVVTLAAWKNLIVGGTMVGGGGGSHPTHKEAHIFLWDPASRTKIFETIPVPGASGINDLVLARNGLVYGIAHGTLFVFDPASRTIKDRKALPFSGGIYNSIAAGPDGKLWGLASQGIFRIDPATNETTVIAKSPKPLTGGFAMRDGAIYFVCGAEIWRWQPALP